MVKNYDQQIAVTSTSSVDVLYQVHGCVHRVLATIDAGVILSDVSSHRIFLVQRDDGSIGIPPRERIERMLASGEMSAIETSSVPSDAVARMNAQITLLDEADVSNGVKAIWLHLSAAWSEDMRSRYGPFDDPSTIRRWRTIRRKTSKKNGVADAK